MADDTRQQISDLERIELLNKSILELEQKIADLKNEAKRQAQVELETLRGKRKELENQDEYLQKQENFYRTLIDRTKDVNLKLEMQAKLLDTIRNKETSRLGEILKSGKATKEEVKQYEELVKTQEKLNKAAERSPDYIKSLFSTDGSKAITKGIQNISGDIEKRLTKNLQNSIKGATNLKGAMKAAAGPAIALAIFSVAKAIIELAITVGNAENAFMKATGASQDFARNLSETYKEARKFGAEAEQVGKAMTSLYSSFTDFSTQNDRVVQKLATTAAVLEKMGVSTDDFAKSVQNMTKSMGMSAEMAGQTMLDLEKFAEDLGVAPSKLAADFAGAGGALAKFGSQGVEAFKRLQVASKVTGMEMNRILAIVDKFDTFEGAATQAGKLNAALGGNFVNAMDLMMQTDPVDRFNQIRDSILQAGLSFDTMSYYQKNFYKEALGLSDVNELSLLLSGRTDLMADSFSQSSQSIEEAAERAKTLASFQEQLKIAFAEMIPVVTPLIDAFRSIIKVLVPIIQILAGMAEVIGLIIDPIAMVATGLGDLFSTAEGGISVLKTLGTVMGVVGLIFVAATSPVWATVAAIAALLAGIGLLMKYMFKVRNSPTFMESLGVMADGFEGISDKISGTTENMKGLRQEMEKGAVPSAAEAVGGAAGGANSTTMYSATANNQNRDQIRDITVKFTLDEKVLEEKTLRIVANELKSVTTLS